MALKAERFIHSILPATRRVNHYWCNEAVDFPVRLWVIIPQDRHVSIFNSKVKFYGLQMSGYVSKELLQSISLEALIEVEVEIGRV